jgi:hypothetical protein
MTRQPINPVEVEYQIMDVCEAMETETEQYARLSELAASSEAKYKLVYAKSLVDMASQSSTKMTAQERQARADLISNDEFRIFRINEARRVSSKEALLSLRARLDALRTLSASLRHQT